MRVNVLSLLGLGFLLLAIFGALRVRRDLAASETHWERALFGRGVPISRWQSPVRFWCAIAVNTAIVLLFALVASVAFRVTALRWIR